MGKYEKVLYYSCSISFNVNFAKRSFTLNCRLFKSGQIVQIFALLFGQELIASEHSKTIGFFLQQQQQFLKLLALLLVYLKQNHHLHLCEILLNLLFARFCIIFAKNDFEICNSFDRISTFIGSLCFDIDSKDNNAYSLFLLITFLSNIKFYLYCTKVLINFVSIKRDYGNHNPFFKV